MVKTKKTKKAKVKKIANVLQLVIVNLAPARPKSRNTKAFFNNGFNKFQAQSRMMNELSSMPNKIKDIISDRQNDTYKEMESKFKEFSVEQDFMKRQIKARVEKQALDKYLENIGGTLNKSLRELKSGVIDTPTGIQKDE